MCDLGGRRSAGRLPFDIPINNAATILDQLFETVSLTEYEEQRGVRPCGLTSSGRDFDRLAGVTDLILNRTEIAQR